ncbi:hypothetical protein SAMN05216302_10013 [Nitrosomonas aestuarii]|uniref:Phage integrase family protein n=1 Tax=Nitrosomonas aestuarii TaxID=52441 RepID=A0A1I3WVW8_9PROT|nr:hypothetical protein [Nitrosomonas aestuarii]SFK11632.1 hypothetical protein SAMN05216302_10013 [Nitrosomonas aestuarii]
MEKPCQHLCSTFGETAPRSFEHVIAWLVIGQVMSFNPAASVHGPKHVVREGKTTILDEHEVPELLESLSTGKLSDLSDRAILGFMVYSFARVSASTKMQAKDLLSARQ